MLWHLSLFIFCPSPVIVSLGNSRAISNLEEKWMSTVDRSRSSYNFGYAKGQINGEFEEKAANQAIFRSSTSSRSQGKTLTWSLNYYDFFLPFLKLGL